MPLDRRDFIRSAALGSGALLLPSCQGDQTSRDRTPEVLEQLNEAAARLVLNPQEISSPVVIESMELLRSGRDVFLRVRSRDGAEGISVTNGRAYLSPILKQLIIPYFIGKDARQLEEHLFGVYRHGSNYKLKSLALWAPVAWVEFAVLDMLGRIANKSIGDLVGGPVRSELAFYNASGNRDTTAQEEVVILQEMVERSGGKAVKFRVGGRMSRNADALPGRTETLIPLARKVLGDDVALHADSNSSYDPPQAIEVGKMLEDVGALFYEEPCPFDRWEDTKVVTDALTIPVAGGEQESSQYRFRQVIHDQAVDIVQPDLFYYGGIIRSMRVARMADVQGMPTTCHVSGGFCFVYMLHFASCIQNPGPFQEYKSVGVERYGDWFDPPLKSTNGAITVPRGPGVGIANPGELLKDAEPVS